MRLKTWVEDCGIFPQPERLLVVRETGGTRSRISAGSMRCGNAVNTFDDTPSELRACADHISVTSPELFFHTEKLMTSQTQEPQRASLHLTIPDVPRLRRHCFENSRDASISYTSSCLLFSRLRHETQFHFDRSVLHLPAFNFVGLCSGGEACSWPKRAV